MFNFKPQAAQEAQKEFISAFEKIERKRKNHA